MRIFPHMNQVGQDVCPICKTKDDKPVVLIAIAGTEEGNNILAQQVHVDCLDLRIVTSHETGHKALVQFLD
jgi:hypothetical protein